MIGTNDMVVLQTVVLAFGSTGDKAVLTVPPGRWMVDSSYILITGASAHATAGTVRLDVRPIAGADTNRTDGTAGILKKTASVAEAGKMIYWRPPSATAVPPAAGAHTFVQGGYEIVVEVTVAQGEALAFYAGVMLREQPEAYTNVTTMALTA